MAWVTVSAIALSTGWVQAASLGNGAASAVLGQTLDFPVNVRLEAGETLDPECVSAEVSVGDRRLAAGAVRVLVEPTGAETARLRVQTNQLIDEPLVAVQLNAGCGNKHSRRYVVLADPPAPAAATVALPVYAAALPDAAAVATAATAQTTSITDTAAASTTSRAMARVAAGPAAAASRAAVRRVALREGAPEAVPARAQRRAEARANKRRAAATTVARAEPVRRTVRRVADAAPRLKLDMAAPTVAMAATTSAVDQALEAVAQAAVAARQSASAASAAAERMAALERTVEQLRGDAKANRELAAQMREELVRAEAASGWTWPLLASAVALAALAAWLGLRLAAARRQQDQAWLLAARQSQQAPRSDLDSGDGATRPATLARGGSDSRLRTAPGSFAGGNSGFQNGQSLARTATAPAWPPPAPAEPWSPYASEPGVQRMQTPAQTPAKTPAPQPAPVPAPVAEPSPAPRLRVVSSAVPAPMARMADSVSPSQVTAALPPSVRQGEPGPRDVSIDELLDLEQQAEFFVVLGQDEAAIDLLVEHLRHTGGGSPLPYLKLLEIYRRRGDRADYERTRARFNHRFNAYAPEWEVDLQAGRNLEDYTGVLPRLQSVWPRPLDSMAELEALLFRKSRGELFDLPAYREVLFLYALARDLLDRESAETGLVDLLLPLSDGGDFGSTSPTPFSELGRDSRPGSLDFEDRPTAPVDLDLSLDNERPTSIFDQLDDQPHSPRRR